MSVALAIDLGGSRLRAGLVAADDPTVVRPVGKWPAPRNLEDFEVVIGRLAASHGATAIGIAVPGTVGGTTCLWIPNLPYLDGVDVARLFPRLSVGVGHDAQLALLAEATHGAAKGVADAILVAIGTGIGSAVLSGSRILRGTHGAACSFGWACADLADAGDPRDGWLERHASGRALGRAAASIGLAQGEALVEAARAGDGVARQAIEGPARALGVALSGAVGLLDPALVILTGGVAAAADVIAPVALAAMRRQLPRHLHGIDIVAGRFGPDASLFGAAIAAVNGADWSSVG